MARKRKSTDSEENDSLGAQWQRWLELMQLWLMDLQMNGWPGMPPPPPGLPLGRGLMIAPTKKMQKLMGINVAGRRGPGSEVAMINGFPNYTQNETRTEYNDIGLVHNLNRGSPHLQNLHPYYNNIRDQRGWYGYGSGQAIGQALIGGDDGMPPPMTGPFVEPDRQRGRPISKRRK